MASTPWPIIAHDPGELFSRFCSLGIHVPDRNASKDQFAEEMYCLRRYLFPLAAAGLLQFPLSVTKGEEPDFSLASTGGVVGLEVTRATEEGFEEDLTHLARRQNTRHYPSDPASGVMDLDVDGWLGNAADAELARHVLVSIQRKIDRIDAYTTAQCDLLIYDNTPTPPPRLNVVVNEVRAGLHDNPLRSRGGRVFRVISLIRDPRLIYDLERSRRSLTYKPEWNVAPAS